MYRLLIPLFCFILSYQTSYAQIPVPVKNNGTAPLPIPGMQRAPLICGSAGTFNFGTFIGQSNDISLPELYFCKGDSIFIDHVGDFDLSGDPIPGTPPGIAYAFYTCPPTVEGDTRAAVLADPCVLISSGDIVVAKGQANGDTWFFNNGALQAANVGAPIRYHFAPITLDDFNGSFHENGGPCVNVNLAETFSVVYLNEVQISSLTTGVNNCQGSFKVSGGLPEFDPTARFTVDISLVSNPAIKGTVLSVPSQIVHNAFVNFSVPQTGVYTIRVQDGKSCEAIVTVNMTACDVNDAVLVEAPDVLAAPGQTVCIDVVSPNFPDDVLGTNFSVSWNPGVIQFSSITSDLPGFSTINNTNLTNTSSGQLGFIYSSPDLISPITLPSGNILFTLCFTATGSIGQSTGIGFSASPTPINFDDIMGMPIAPIFNFGSVTIAPPQPLDLTLSFEDTLCNGTATLNVKATGGNTPYLVQWQKTLPNPGGVNPGNIANNGGTYMAAGLTSGTYSVTITDDDGFGTSVVKTIMLNLPSLGVQLNLIDNEPTCNGDLDGKAIAIVQINGTSVPNPGPDYTFEWTIPPPSVPVPNSTMQMGGAGLYSVTVTNTISGCTAPASGTMSHPSILRKNGNPIILPTTCSSINNGQINYAMQGGTAQAGGDYVFQWNYAPSSGAPSTPFQGPTSANPSVIMGLQNGIYYLTVTDVNMCEWIDSVEIISLKELDITLLDNTSPSCYGGSDGSLTISASTIPAQLTAFMFNWSPNPPGALTLNGTTQSIFSELPAGTYCVTATEVGTTCSVTDCITIAQPDSLAISVLNSVNPTCDMPNSGSISVLTQGGAPQYTYQWGPNPPVSTTSAFAGNLTAGTYTVTATDSEGCSNSKTITLTLPASPTLTYDSTSVNCGGDGVLIANATAASGSTVTGYQWIDLSTSTVISTNSQTTNLSGGDYQIIVTDSKNCQTIDTISLFQPNIMIIDTIIETKPSCFGLMDGSIAVVVNGGLPPYTYIWSVPSAGLPVLPQIQAGLYSVTIRDQNLCEINASIILENPAPIVNTFTNVIPASCPNTCDGMATANPEYATIPPTSGVFTYLWENGENTPTADSLCPGYNVVTIIDGNNCSIQDSVEITKPADILLDNFNSIPTTCYGDSDGSITVNASGGNGAPFNYDWAIALGNTVTNLSAGDYEVTVTDNQGCTQAFTVGVIEPDSLTLTYDTLLSTQIRCYNATDAILVVQTQGGTPGYTYAWSSGDSDSNIQGGLDAGTYFVTVTDVNGCTGTSLPITLTNPPPVVGSADPFEPIICEGDETIFTIDTIYGGSGGPFSFTVDYGINLPPDFPVALGSGTHYISYQDQYGCSFEDSIYVTPGINLQVNFPETEVEVELGDTLYQLLPTISGGIYHTFYWTNGHLLSDSTIIDPYAETFASTSYKLTVIDTVNGCMGMGSVRIEIDPNRNVYIPNIFNPSSTLGLNTHFFPKVGNGVRKINYMQVFDRWGELVYEQKNFLPNSFELEEGWDGTYRGSKAPTGVYVYIIEVEFMDNRTLLYRGDVTLIR